LIRAQAWRFPRIGESGTLTVVREDAPDKYSWWKMVANEERRANHGTRPEKTHTLYLPTADMVPPGPQGKKVAHRETGTMELLIVRSNLRV